MPEPTVVHRPSVFLSSTIGDFSDLRDSLRYWLEEMGLEVRVSEHTDFKRRPEDGTFSACFNSIRSSDYYVLLIGTRRGSWYDAKKRISVTRQEYREALEAFKDTGTPRIITVVRSDVLVALREREKSRSRAKQSVLEDWKFTREFLKEVRKVKEVEKATKGESEYPVGNWLSPFRDFRELTSALRATMALSSPLPRAALLESLRWECRHNLRLLLTKTKRRPFYSHHWLGGVRRAVKLEPEKLDPNGPGLELSHEQYQDVVVQLITGLAQPEKFIQTVANQAITTGAFLEYDRQSQNYVTTPLLKALYRLRDEIETYRGRHATLQKQQAEVFRVWDIVRPEKNGARISPITLVGMFAVDDNLYNIERILVGVLRQLHGHTEAVEIQYRPTSPVPKFQLEIERETVTDDDLDKWLTDDDLLLRVGMTDFTEEQRQQHEQFDALLREALGEEKYEEMKKSVTDKLLGFDAEDSK